MVHYLWGKRVMLVDAVPKGWRHSRGCILMTHDELRRVMMDIADVRNVKEAFASELWDAA